MASTSTQPKLEIASPPEVPAVSNAHRWIDLGLVLSVAFAASILGSVYLAIYPVRPEYSNIRLAVGILEETITLLLFLVLFKRQKRRLQEIGFGFRWTDLPKALGLALAAFAIMRVATFAINYAWFLVTLRSVHWLETRAMLSGTSLWLLVPFLVINPFFEEILVRGYLMTEFIDLRKSVTSATLVSIGFQTSYHLYYGVPGAVIVGSGLAVFALYFAKSRRLMPVILAHMIWDLIASAGSWHH